MASSAAAEVREPAIDRKAAWALPGHADIWLFVLFEAVVFGSYFVVYMLHRVWDTACFLESQQTLSQNFGAANTVILLVSSWFVARAVHAAREQRFDAAQGQLYMTLLCGALFAGSKMFEWSAKIAAGYTLTTNEFFSFYYFLTGIHVLHVLLGFVFLSVAIHQLAGPQRRSMKIIETGATYWHMVDFLWVIIFALLYVMR